MFPTHRPLCGAAPQNKTKRHKLIVWRKTNKKHVNFRSTCPAPSVDDRNGGKLTRWGHHTLLPCLWETLALLFYCNIIIVLVSHAMLCSGPGFPIMSTCGALRRLLRYDLPKLFTSIVVVPERSLRSLLRKHSLRSSETALSIKKVLNRLVRDRFSISCACT